MQDDENDWREDIEAQQRQFDIEHRQIEWLFQKEHAMRGRAGRHRQIEHECKEAEPQRLHALGRMVERGGQGLDIFRAGLAVASLGNRFLSRVVEHRALALRGVRDRKPSQLADGGQGEMVSEGATGMAKLFGY